MYYELTHAGLHFKHQVALPIVYGGVELPMAYRVDYIVEDCLIVELKCVDKLAPVHMAQLMTYLKLSRKKLGLLINFNVARLKNGIKRVIHGQLS